MIPCSLRPAEPRAAVVADMSFDEAGAMRCAVFHRALIRSSARLTYDQVQDWHDGHASATDIGTQDDILRNLLAHGRRWTARVRSGSHWR